ncbi:MAG: DUF4388 domain-containing protein, partial [Nitrospirae bacterium]|nr:DUF4388 domain-containing protein [Nitrospirota bacterium]
MALEGSLKDFGLADILQLIGLQKKTGVLTMKNPSTEAKVLFENGSVVLADTAQLKGLEKIGEVLVRVGLISQDQLKQAIAKQRYSHKKIGIILVEMGALKKEDLVKALGLRVKETVLSLFKWKEGRYRFEASEVEYERDYCPLMNTEFIIMEGVRQLDEWPYIKKIIPNLDLIFGNNSDHTEKAVQIKASQVSVDDLNEKIQITQDQMSVYRLVDGQKNVRDLIELSQLGEFETCKALSSLLTVGLILQKPIAEMPITEPEKPIGMELKRLLFTGQLIYNGLIIAVCLILLGLGIKNMTYEIPATVYL